jgi:hypothetical protein
MLRILELTHEVAPVSRVLEQAGCLRSVLEQLEKNGILYIEDERVINLAIRTKPPALEPLPLTAPSHDLLSIGSVP